MTCGERPSRLSLLVVCAAALSCHSPEEPVPPSAPVMAVAEAWAGSTVMIHGGALSEGGDSAVVQLSSGVTLPLARVNDTTMSFAVPPTLGGQVLAHLKLNSDSVYLGPLLVNGYVSTQTYAPNIVYDAYPLKTASHATVIGGTTVCAGTCGQIGFTVFDLDVRTFTTYDSILDYSILHGPGPTYLDSTFVLAGRDGALRTWRLAADHSVAESAPALNVGCCGVWQAMRLGPNAWLLTGKLGVSTPLSNIMISEPQGVYLSPRKDRATIAVNYAAAGTPVFDASGQLVYTVSQVRNPKGIDFSADGGSLAIAGGSFFDPGQASRLLLVNATTGVVLRDTLLGRPAFAVSFDPVRPLLYVGVTGVGGFPTVLVLNASTLEVAGNLAVPTSGMPCALQDCSHGVIALSATNSLYVFWSYNGPSRAYRFTLPAAGGH